ncbi:acylphosphatase [candidate division TA06 bacterium]|uniref:Acylphosphatase n=1 Tax=candidate division TA06 bacterium TaxID=2250710 RepID=A0A523URU7_UNCT6|nr:MAG: acylphosphatase [candidate division TA06 bacterium]
MAEARLRVIVTGTVQGVFFRAATESTARQLNLKGWVRNASDGSVEAVFEGSKENAEKMLSWCHHGPPGARVMSVEEIWEEPTGEFDDFTIRYT